MKKIAFSFCLFLSVTVPFICVSQPENDFLELKSSSDSLVGFNEEQASQDALARGFFGSEYKVFMYFAKREYIRFKYGFPDHSNLSKGTPPEINAAPCMNEDFEASPVGNAYSIAGWSLSQGQNSIVNGSCSMIGCCPNPPTTSSDFWIVATPNVDPIIGTIPVSPFGGVNVLKMNDDLINRGEVTRIQQTFPVTPSNALFSFAYMAAMDGSGHACCDQPYMKITLLDCSGNPMACPSISITPPGSLCASAVPGGWTTNANNISLTTAWQVSAIDLTSYLGSCVTIQVTVGDCDGWAHYGYIYFDAQCGPMTVVVNDVPYPVGTSAIGVNACGTATVIAPPGLGPYNWDGPPGSGISGYTNQSFTNTVAGNYTLTINPLGACAPITRIVSLNFVPPPTAGFSTSNICRDFTINNTGTPAPAFQVYSFSGTGPLPSAISTTNTTSTFSLDLPGTYTVIQTMYYAGCTNSTQVIVTAPAASHTIISDNAASCPPSCVNYTCVANPSAQSCIWKMGDGSTLSGPLTAYACYYSAGIYTISTEVTHVNSCKSNATYTAEVYPLPIADFNHAPLKPVVNIDPRVDFTDASYGANVVSWNWYFMNTPQYQSSYQNPHFTYEDPGEYVVALVVKSDHGCLDTILRKIIVGEDFGIYVPNTFTPNSDGLDDIFQPKGFGIVNYNFEIFDRWGEKIFETNEFEKGWDGIYQGRGGKICQEDVYVWKIKVTSVFNKAYEYTGHVTLLK